MYTPPSIHKRRVLHVAWGYDALNSRHHPSWVNCS